MVDIHCVATYIVPPTVCRNEWLQEKCTASARPRRNVIPEDSTSLRPLALGEGGGQGGGPYLATACSSGNPGSIHGASPTTAAGGGSPFLTQYSAVPSARLPPEAGKHHR